ncbi:MAG: hypothetical protein JXR83_17065 [Deltaproteobacteria bacterium]|nr:hypothetical protein [Deltaproteobacteria bacterium]
MDGTGGAAVGPSKEWLAMKMARGVLAAMAWSGALAAACGPELPIGVQARFGVLPQSLESCPAAPVDKPDYVNEVDLFRLKLTGDGLKQPLLRDFAASDARSDNAIQLDGVPAGDPRHLLVSGLVGESKSALTLWRGAHLGFKVEAGKTVDVPVLMTKLSTMTCTRTPLFSPRMFGSATPLADGRVLVAGGFHQSSVNPTTFIRDYVATDTAEIYDPFTGTFSETGRMTWTRGLHQATRLGDGRVLIVGGAEKLQFDPAYASVPRPFPLQPQQLVPWVEVFDPATGTFTRLTLDPALQTMLAFHTATTLADGSVLIAGGGPDVTAATNETILCRGSGAEVVCTAGPRMARHRLGHTATLLDDDRVFMWGGVTDSSVAGICTDAGVTVCPEWYRPEQNVFVAVDPNNVVAGAGDSNNVFFASATKVTTDIGAFVMIAGGLRRDHAQEQPPDNPLVFTGPIRDVRLYSPVENKLGATQGNYDLRAGRLFPNAISLAWLGRAYIAGGYNNMGEMLPARDMEVFDFRESGIQPDLTAEGQPVLLRQARGGAAAVHVGGSAVVVFGGEDGQTGGSRTVLNTAEIYTDKMEPQL